MKFYWKSTPMSQEKSARCTQKTTTIPCSGAFSQRSQRNGEVNSDDRINKPIHYRSHPSGVEAITLTRHESFNIGNCFKYLLRRKFKGDELADLKKCRYYLDEEIRIIESGTRKSN